MTPILKVKKLDPNAIIPTRGSVEASGLDLYCLEEVVLLPGETKIVKTGVAFQIPKGYEIQVRARSGLSAKTPLRVANGIGTVDRDYQGECGIICWHSFIGGEPIRIKAGDRIAQAVLCPVALPWVEEVSSFQEETKRGGSGYGSTGV